MLMPDKYTSLGGSIVGQGAQLIGLSRPNQTLTELWHEAKANDLGLSYERLILVLDYLFSLGVIRLRRGVLVWSHHED